MIDPKIHLGFRGKSGVDHDIDFVDPKLSKIIKRCQDLPGEELFAYVNDKGEPVDITSTHVNDYLKQITGEDFTAKDLRTWGGTCKALEVLTGEFVTEELNEKKWAKRHLGVIKATASHLHNTVTVCRKYYIHPQIFETDKSGKLGDLWRACRSSKTLSREENLLCKILKG